MRDATLPPPTAPSGAATIDAFEEALGKACACHGEDPCEGLWQRQFEDVDRTCVIEALDRAGDVTRCAMDEAMNLAKCLETDTCTSCNLALLTEDTPLGDLIGENCPRAQAAAYQRELLAADRCLQR